LNSIERDWFSASRQGFQPVGTDRNSSTEPDRWKRNAPEVRIVTGVPPVKRPILRANVRFLATASAKPAGSYPSGQPAV